MRMQCTYSKRTPLFAIAFCLLLATALGGCASKNPLIEDSAPLAQKAKTETASNAKAETEKSAAFTEPVEPAKSAAAVVPQVAAPDAVATTDKNTANNATVTTANDSTSKVTANAAAPVASSVHTEKKKRFLGFLSPYRPDVQQGNFVSREMVAQLKPGMTQNQVTFLLGTPLLTDIFHQSRWDYVFRMQKGNGDVTSSRVTVYFDNGLVSHFEGGGDLPTEADYLARIAGKVKAAKK